MLFQIPFCVCKILLIKAGLERFFFENNNRYLFSSQSSGRISIILAGKEKPREIECSDSVMLIKETSYLSFSNSKNRKYRIGFYSLKIMLWLKMWMKKNIQNICYYMYIHKKTSCHIRNKFYQALFCLKFQLNRLEDTVPLKTVLHVSSKLFIIEH